MIQLKLWLLNMKITSLAWWLFLVQKRSTLKSLMFWKKSKSKRTNLEANLTPFMVISILETNLLKISNSAADSRVSNVVSKVPNFLEDKNKELQLLELSLENQEFFSLMKLLQLWTKTPKRKFKKLLTTPWKEGLLSSLPIECLLLKVAIRSTSLIVEKFWKKETSKSSKLSQEVSLPTKIRKKQQLLNLDY